MTKYPNLFEAVKQAVGLCNRWRFMYADEIYDRDSFPGIAEVYDEDSMADEDSYYIVAPSGAIGFVEDEENPIEWLFVREDNQKEVLPTSINEMTIGEMSNSGLTVESIGESIFCSNCGTKVESDSVFCEKCGEKIK